MAKITHRDPSTLSRFERGLSAPRDLDAVVAAYQGLEGSDERAIARAAHAERKVRRWPPVYVALVAAVALVALATHAQDEQQPLALEASAAASRAPSRASEASRHAAVERLERVDRAGARRALRRRPRRVRGSRRAAHDSVRRRGRDRRVAAGSSVADRPAALRGCAGRGALRVALVEVYPAAALVAWGFDVRGYKAPAATDRRRTILDGLTAAAG